MSEKNKYDMRHISKILFLLYCITLSAVAAEDDKSEVIRNEKYWNQWGDLAGVVKKNKLY